MACDLRGVSEAGPLVRTLALLRNLQEVNPLQAFLRSTSIKKLAQFKPLRTLQAPASAQGSACASAVFKRGRAQDFRTHLISGDTRRSSLPLAQLRNLRLPDARVLSRRYAIDTSAGR